MKVWYTVYWGWHLCRPLSKAIVILILIFYFTHPIKHPFPRFHSSFRMQFNLPMYNVTNLGIKTLRVEEQFSNTQSKEGPQRWVRYITQSHSYVCRLWTHKTNNDKFLNLLDWSLSSFKIKEKLKFYQPPQRHQQHRLLSIRLIISKIVRVKVAIRGFIVLQWISWIFFFFKFVLYLQLFSCLRSFISCR